MYIKAGLRADSYIYISSFERVVILSEQQHADHKDIQLQGPITEKYSFKGPGANAHIQYIKSKKSATNM